MNADLKHLSVLLGCMGIACLFCKASVCLLCSKCLETHRLHVSSWLGFPVSQNYLELYKLFNSSVKFLAVLKTK